MPPALLEAERLPNVALTLGAFRHLPQGVVAMSRMLQEVRRGEMPRDLGRHIGRVIADLDEVAVAAYRRLVGEDIAPVEAIVLNARVEPLPDPDSRVTLTAERDALGMRRVRLDWRPGEAGARALRRAHELIALEAGRAGIGRVRIDLPARGWPAAMQPSGHHIGTARMHVDPRSGVVDRDCRVHGLDAVYIAGSAVFPNAGCNNPTLTIVALALRLADHLKARFG
jgi:choline dehydrogenase-like flavoprotein